MSNTWQPIGTYPRELDEPTECWWGPSVVILVNTKYGPVPYVAHLDADVWLVRDAEDPDSWGDLFAPPTHWMPLPELPK